MWLDSRSIGGPRAFSLCGCRPGRLYPDAEVYYGRVLGYSRPPHLLAHPGHQQKAGMRLQLDSRGGDGRDKLFVAHGGMPRPGIVAETSATLPQDEILGGQPGDASVRQNRAQPNNAPPTTNSQDFGGLAP